MSPFQFRPPVERTDDGLVLHIDDEERALIVRLLGELREIVSAQADGGDALDEHVAQRLSPVVYRDDQEQEAEYQRLMSDELVASRLGAIDIVTAALGSSTPCFDDGGANAFIRAINTIRLVLGTMLGITEDDDEGDDSPEYSLYAFLSWLLDWTIREM